MDVDDELVLSELRRCEAERKLRQLPTDVLETAWVREAQIEAVVDAVLAMQYADNTAGYIRARHVGEWCARIVTAQAGSLEPRIARRAGVLSEVDARILRGIPELEHIVTCETYMRVVIGVATAFEDLSAGEMSPRRALRRLLETATGETMLAIRALWQILAGDVVPDRNEAPRQEHYDRFHAFA